MKKTLLMLMAVVMVGCGTPKWMDEIMQANWDNAVASGAYTYNEAIKQMGPATALERSSHLGEWLAPRFIEMLDKHEIAATCLTAGPIVSIEFGAFDASELFDFLNGVGIHIKWISNTLSNGKQQNILRIGLPYYETKARLRVVLALIDDFLE